MNPAPQAQNVKAIFFDIDGTLLSGTTHTVPQSAQNALWQAHRRGYLLFLSTGRHPAEIAQVPELAALPFSGTVAMNGQYCTSGGQVIYQQALPDSDVRQLADFLETAPYAALYARENGLFLTRMTDVVQEICESIGTQPTQVRGLTHLRSAPILQLGLFLGRDPVPDAVESLPGCFWTRWHQFGIDISPLNGGKWTGVTKMARQFGIAPHQIMAVGDNDNDVDMLAQAAFAVAMGNGTEKAKKAAHHITAGVDEHGIALALGHLPGLASI